jgi:hypothetical protein
MSEKTVCSQKYEVNSEEIEMLSDRPPGADITAVVRHIELRHDRLAIIELWKWRVWHRFVGQTRSRIDENLFALSFQS